MGLPACGGSPSSASGDSGTDASQTSTDAGSDGAQAIAPLLVDDESKSTGEISLPNGGTWYTFPLGAPVTPVPGDPFFFTMVDAGTFSSAACFSGSDVTGFGAGAGIELQLPLPDGALVAYDAGAYSRLTFYAMSPDLAEMLVSIVDEQTDNFWPGATCAGGADAGPVPDGGYPQPPCGNPSRAAVPLASTWQQVSLSFANLSAFNSPGFYAPTRVAQTGLLFVTFRANNPNFGIDGGAPLSFHICVAEVYLAP
jgi:hypothetical protein